MDAKTLQLDYFLFYETAQELVDERVSLMCQFDEEPERALVQQRRRFGDRVEKNNEGIFDDNYSLTWYDLFDPKPDPERVVYYDDQFGTAQKILIERLLAVLTPTRCKSAGRDFPKELDHYKVYEVVDSGGRLGKSADFDGEFQSGAATVGRPLYFCAPAMKEHGRQRFEIKNEKAHLVIYELQANAQEPVWAETRDQFGKYEFALHRNRMIAVPCIKEKWEFT